MDTKATLEAHIESVAGAPHITISERTEASERVHEIPLEAIASWSELLGIEDPGEALDAIRYVAEQGEPEADAATGENAWTPAYGALAAREQARAETWFAATREGTAEDPRSPRLRAAFAATPLEPEVTAARNETRTRLGLPPLGSIQARAARTLNSDEDPLAGLKAELRTAKAETITHARETFLSQLRPSLPTDQEEAH